MFCDGAGVVVIKRLSDAQADGDTIYCLVRGSGKNNNGARPASFLAPSMEGQAEVIDLAQGDANIPVESIGYIEAHGTGTPSVIRLNSRRSARYSSKKPRKNSSAT